MIWSRWFTQVSLRFSSLSGGQGEATVECSLEDSAQKFGLRSGLDYGSIHLRREVWGSLGHPPAQGPEVGMWQVLIILNQGSSTSSFVHMSGWTILCGPSRVL